MTGLRPGGVAPSVGIGITNLIFTFVGLWLIDRLVGARSYISAHLAILLRWV